MRDGTIEVSVDVGYENGQWCYVDAYDVGCRSGNFLS